MPFLPRDFVGSLKSSSVIRGIGLLLEFAVNQTVEISVDTYKGMEDGLFQDCLDDLFPFPEVKTVQAIVPTDRLWIRILWPHFIKHMAVSFYKGGW